VLMQEAEDEARRRRPARYESGIWTGAEQRYDAGKRELRGLLMALKKLRFWLYGVHFYVELDANTVVAQLNLPSNDLPGAVVTRWLAWIRLFDFDVIHVPGKRHTAADGLSRRPPQEGEGCRTGMPSDDSDFETMMDAQVGSTSVGSQAFSNLTHASDS